MLYFIVVFLLLLGMLLYFRIAEKYNIIDKPNSRSAHSHVTIRGGGIIFILAYLLFLLFLFWKGGSFMLPNNFLIFGAGFVVLSAVSFVDDIVDSSTKIRLVYQFLSVSILFYFIQLFQILPWYWLPIVYTVVIGTMNAFNFMDGINGMTGLYSLGILVTLLFIQQQKWAFTEVDFIVFPILACLVFLFFNLRKKAKCFMGDVGSMGVAFWTLALIGLLIVKTGELKWILMLSVYGVEVVLTILERIKLKENIFQAHKRHLYQLLVNEKKRSHVAVSVMYTFVQILINIALIYLPFSDLMLFFLILFPVAFIYLFIKIKIKSQISKKTL